MRVVSAVVVVRVIEIRRIALMRIPCVGQARQRARESVGARKGAEVVVERAVFLHDEDQVLQDAGTARRIAARGGAGNARGGDGERREKRRPQSADEMLHRMLLLSRRLRSSG